MPLESIIQPSIASYSSNLPVEVIAVDGQVKVSTTDNIGISGVIRQKICAMQLTLMGGLKSDENASVQIDVALANFDQSHLLPFHLGECPKIAKSLA